MSTSKSKLDAGIVRELAAILREADLGEVEVEQVACVSLVGEDGLWFSRDNFNFKNIAFE